MTTIQLIVLHMQIFATIAAVLFIGLVFRNAFRELVHFRTGRRSPRGPKTLCSTEIHDRATQAGRVQQSPVLGESLPRRTDAAGHV